MGSNKTGKWVTGLVALSLIGSAASVATAAEPLENLRYAISGGSPNLDLRLRYEGVNQDNALEKADALTLRTRLGYTTGKWNQLDASAEYEGIAYAGDEQYDNNPAPTIGRAGYSIIPDPKGSELNQAWVRYTGIKDTVLKLGRQRLIFDNARWIGNVGWRQNEMTYDAYLLTNTSLPKTTVNYAYLSNANTIFFSDFQLHAHLLNVAYVATPWLKLSAYGYLLDFDLDVAIRQDTQTLGLRAAGEIEKGPGKLSYAVEYAQQSDYEDSVDTVDADYTLIEVGYGVKLIGGKLGYEVLGSNDGLYGLQTPLATLHAHVGWADQFLNTPATGLRNVYASLNGTAYNLAWLVRYHQWTADSGGADYGTEVDLQVTYPINDSLSVGAKYADYNADSFSVDTRKTWLSAEYKF